MRLQREASLVWKGFAFLLYKFIWSQIYPNCFTLNWETLLGIYMYKTKIDLSQVYNFGLGLLGALKYKGFQFSGTPY